MTPYDILWPALKPPPNSARAGSEQGKVVEEPGVGRKGGVAGKGGMTRMSFPISFCTLLHSHLFVLVFSIGIIIFAGRRYWDAGRLARLCASIARFVP